MHECCAQANERGWPHQIHIGTHNLGQSTPIPLAALATRYPRMKLVLIHTWPYHRESGFLAKQFPNVYLDSCWLPVLSPAFLREALANWLNYVPANKIMLSHDSTSIEMAVGSMLFTREILAEALEKANCGCGAGEQELLALAADMLHHNAARVY